MTNILNRSAGILSLLVLFFAAGCDSASQDPAPRPLKPLSQVESQIVESDNEFGLNLFSQLNADNGNENLFISPTSISLALGMTLNGASENTHTEMVDVLRKQGLTDEAINQSYKSLIDLLTGLDPKVTLNIANSIWYKEGFTVTPEFINTNKNHFYAEVAALDFGNPASVNVINGWVDDKTEGLIDSIIESIGADAVMYLINAIYFKGDWTYQFDTSKTQDQPFHNAAGTTTQIPLMNLEGSVATTTNADVQLIDLPYGDSLYSMTVVLPQDPAGLDQVIAKLTPAVWDQWIGQLYHKNLDVYLPKFKLAYETSLKDVLVTLGMADAFSSQNANFSRINADQQLFISEVKHKSVVDVHERGTEAAAVTAITIETTSIGSNIFRADRPFVLAIRERHTGAILFIGKVIEL